MACRGVVLDSASALLVSCTKCFEAHGIVRLRNHASERLFPTRFGSTPGPGSLGSRCSRSRGYGVLLQHRGPVVVGVLVAALVAGPAWAGHSTQTAAWTGHRSTDLRGASAAQGLFSQTRRPGPANATGKVARVSLGDVEATGRATWSPDGTRIAVKALNDHLLIKNLQTGSVDLVTDAGGAPLSVARTDGPVAWSPDGTRIAVSTEPGWGEENDLGLIVKSLTTGAVQRVDVTANGQPSDTGSFVGNVMWSPKGTQIAFSIESDSKLPGDNAEVRVLVKDLTTGRVEVVSARRTERAKYSARGSDWSPNGSKIMFDSDDPKLVTSDTNGRRVWPDGYDVFVKNLKTGAVTRVSTDGRGRQANNASGSGTWSPDGSKVMFESRADNLVPGDTNRSVDVFVKNLKTGAVTRVSTNSSGKQANGNSSWDALWSPDGRSIAFGSDATNLVPGDTNKTGDVFVKNLKTGYVQRISTSVSGAQGNSWSSLSCWSPDGRQIAFVSEASNLVPNDEKHWDLFVKDLRP